MLALWTGVSNLVFPPLCYWFSGWEGLLEGSKVCPEGRTGSRNLPYGAGGGAGNTCIGHSNWRSTRIKSVHDTPHCSGLSMMLVCLQKTTGTVLQCPPCCKFLLKFWICSLLQWDTKTKPKKIMTAAGGTGQQMCSHYFSGFLWLSVAIVYPLLWLFGGGERGIWAYIKWQQWNSSADRPWQIGTPSYVPVCGVPLALSSVCPGPLLPCCFSLEIS